MAKCLSQELNLPLIKEQARLSLEKLKLPHLDIIKNDNGLFSTFQQDILRRQINEERKYQDIGFVSDRSSCDNVIYYLINTKDCEIIKDTYKILGLNNYKYNYDLVFYIPIMFNLIDDGVRNREIEYQYLVDKEIKKYLHYNPNVFQVTTDSVENRVRECLKIIRENF